MILVSLKAIQHQNIIFFEFSLHEKAKDRRKRSRQSDIMSDLQDLNTILSNYGGNEYDANTVARDLVKDL